MSPELTDKVYEIVAQTIADGLLIVVAAFGANIILERYKAKQALRVEIAKKRVDKLDEIWILFGELEINIKDMFAKIEEYSDSPNDTPLQQLRKFKGLMLPYFTKYDVIDKSIQIMLIKNRFWIGNSFYKIFSEFQDTVKKYTDYLIEGNKDKALEQYKIVQSQKLSVLDFLKNPDE